MNLKFDPNEIINIRCATILNGQSIIIGENPYLPQENEYHNKRQVKPYSFYKDFNQEIFIKITDEKIYSGPLSVMNISEYFDVMSGNENHMTLAGFNNLKKTYYLSRVSLWEYPGASFLKNRIFFLVKILLASYIAHLKYFHHISKQQRVFHFHR